MLDIKPPVPWSNTYSKTFVDLLATVTLDRIVRHSIDTNGDGVADTVVVERQPHYPFQCRAVQLLAREFSARLATGDADYSGDPWDSLFEDLRNTRGSGLISAGVPKADRYLGMATQPHHHASAVVTGPQLSVPEYATELASVIAAAALLPAEIAASASDVAGIDPVLAAAIASDFAAARAGYLATLQARFPNRGFV